MNSPATIAQPETEVAICSTHGEYESRRLFRSIWSKCPTCAAQREVEEKAAADLRARVASREAWERQVGEAGIPDRFKDRSLASFKATTDAQRKALAFSETYADNFDAVLKTGRCALFVGKPGTGKTHLAVGIGLRIMHRDGRSVMFSTVMRAIRRVKDTWNRDSRETESKAIAGLTFPDLLILDEVGVQFGSETEKLILFDVLNERYEKRRPTIIISNLTADEVQTYLGERIFDRMREDGGETVIFDWNSHR